MRNDRTLWASGFAAWAGDRDAPHIGQIDAGAIADGERLIIRQDDYELVLIPVTDGIRGDESRPSSTLLGANVSFAGVYGRVPPDATVLPGPRRRPFESEFWPAEGRPIFEGRGDTIHLFARPTVDSPIVERLRVKTHVPVDYRAYRYRTLRPGTILAKTPVRLEGRNLGDTDYLSRDMYYQGGGEQVAVQLQPGDQLEYIQYRAEGTGFVRWNGLVIELADLPWLGNSTELELITAPVPESWIQITDNAGTPLGWAQADEQLVETGREF